MNTVVTTTITETCDVGHKFPRFSDHPIYKNKLVCPYCAAIGLKHRDEEAEHLEKLNNFLIKQAEHHRWNIEEDADGLLICKNEHDKGQPCKYEKYVKLSDTY